VALILVAGPPSKARPGAGPADPAGRVRCRGRAVCSPAWSGQGQQVRIRDSCW